METITSPSPNTPGEPKNSGGARSIVSGIVGGLVVAAVFTVLILAGVLGEDTRTVVQQGVVTKSGGTNTVSDIYKASADGVVSIRVRVSSGGQDVFGQTQEGLASGTGVVIDKKGYIVTNAHVVENNQGDPTVRFNDEKSVTAKIVGRDASNDIAVLKVDPDKVDLKPLEWADSAKAEVGSQVVAIGSPFGLDQTVTTGIVSALQRQITAPNNFTISNVIQTDAAINPGNSGGPLIDGDGKVLGINSQIATGGGSGGSVGIGFAVPSNTVKKIIPQLEEDGKVDYAYLGVSTSSLTPELAQRLNFGDRDSGAIVACVVNPGPAQKAGLQAGGDSAVINGQETTIGGDLIIAIDGKEVKSSDDVAAKVLEKKPGDTVKITVVRDGKTRTVTAKLGSRPADTNNNCSQDQPDSGG